MNQEVQDVHGIMKNNMDNLLERGGKLSDLDGRAEDLNKSAAMVCMLIITKKRPHFSKRTSDIKTKMQTTYKLTMFS